MAGLILPEFAKTGDGAEGSQGEEGEAGHFQPELVQDAAEGLETGAHAGEQGAADAAAFDHVDGGAEDEPDFFDDLAVDHACITLRRSAAAA